MATRTKIGDQYIRFSVSGLEEAQGDTEKAAKRIEQRWADVRRKVGQRLAAPTTLDAAEKWASVRKNVAGDLRLDNVGKFAQLQNLKDLTKSGLLRPLLRESVELDRQLAKFGKRVEFEQLRAQVGTVRANLTWLGQAVSPVTNALAAIPRKIMSVGGSMAALGAPAAGLLAIAKSATAGTVEGDRMALSWLYVTKVIGDMFAPAIRVGTTILVRLGDTLAGLSPETKGWIVTVGLAGAALVAAGGLAMAFGMMFSGAMGLAGAAVGLVTAAVTVGTGVMDAAFALFGVTAAASWLAALGPVGLVIAGIAAVLAAIVALGVAVGLVSVSMEEGMTHSSQSWVGYTIQGVKLVTVAFAEFWNWMFRQIEQVLAQNAAIGKSMEDAMGSTKASRALIGMNEMFQRNFGEIDKSGLAKAFDAAENWAERNVPSAKSLVKFLKEAKGLVVDAPGMLKDLFKAGGDMKLRPSFDVKFEGLQQSFDRLQEAFAKGSPQDQLGQIRDEGKIANGKLDQIFDRLGQVFGAVGP